MKLSELEQCKVKKHTQGFNTAAQDSIPGCSRQFEALPLSHRDQVNKVVDIVTFKSRS